MHPNTSPSLNGPWPEDDFPFLFRDSPQPMLIYDAETQQVLRTNTALLSEFGYREQELSACTVDVLFWPEVQAAMQKSITHLRGITQASSLWRLRRKNGSPVWVEALSHSLPYQGRSARLVVLKDITDQQEAERSYRALFENALDGIFQTSPEGRYLRANPALARIYGYPSPEALIAGLQDISVQLYVDPARREEFKAQMDAAGEVADFESQIYRRDGSIVWISEQARAVRGEEGQILLYEGSVRDISAHKEAELALRRAEADYRGIFEQAAEGIYRTSPEGQLLRANQALARMLGFDCTEALLETVVETSQNYVNPSRREEFLRLMAAQDSVSGFEYEVWGRGGRLWLSENARAQRGDDGAIVYYEGTIEDITDRKRLEAERERVLAEALERADYDPLTGLLNHRAFQSRCAEEAARAAREGTPLAVAVLDLDNFNFFNASYGHGVGDDVLRQVAEALRGHCRSYDTLARYGGDEFALLMPGATPSEAVQMMQRLQTVVSSLTCRPEGYPVSIPLSASVGLAHLPEDDAEVRGALETAHARLDRAKTGGSDDLALESLRTVLSESFHGFSMLDALVTAVDNKDRYTRRHSEDVMRYSAQIARELGMTEDEVRRVQAAALLHDVGKIGVPDRILRKPGALTDEEFETVKHHPLMGAVIVGAVAGFEETLDAIRHHHERWDGNGYPHGLCGEEIPLDGRLMAVADAFSAMTMDRPYRKGKPPAEALAILAAGAGSQWDPACVAAFERARVAWPFPLTPLPEMTVAAPVS